MRCGLRHFGVFVVSENRYAQIVMTQNLTRLPNWWPGFSTPKFESQSCRAPHSRWGFLLTMKRPGTGGTGPNLEPIGLFPSGGWGQGTSNHVSFGTVRIVSTSIENLLTVRGFSNLDANPRLGRRWLSRYWFALRIPVICNCQQKRLQTIPEPLKVYEPCRADVLRTCSSRQTSASALCGKSRLSRRSGYPEFRSSYRD